MRAYMYVFLILLATFRLVEGWLFQPYPFVCDAYWNCHELLVKQLFRRPAKYFALYEYVYVHIKTKKKTQQYFGGITA